MLGIVACGDGSTQTDAGAPPDLGDDSSSMNDAAIGPTPCKPGDACDDGDPLTTDTCLLGQCVHLGCTDSASCDDSDPLTDDQCHFNTVTGSSACTHLLTDGSCNKASDCDDQIDCTTDTCTGNRCSYTWPDGCTKNLRPIPACPVGATLGSDCDSAPVVISPCLPPGSALPCPEVWICQGGATGYVAVRPAGAACATASCPSTPPPADTACTSSTRYLCDYSPSTSTIDFDTSFLPSHLDGDPPDAPRCTCIPGGNWTCSANYCPWVPPVNGAPFAFPAWSNMTPSSVSCGYRGTSCRVSNVGGSLHWRCWSPRVCPAQAPHTGDACDSLADDSCGYSRLLDSQPANTYTGTCSCNEGATSWTCDPSSTADCPLSQPAVNTMCTHTDGNQACAYFKNGVFDISTNIHCSCPGTLGFQMWQCQ